jgi:branched-chain amino acid transport system permease protein
MKIHERQSVDWAVAVKLGLLGGVITVYLCLVGLVQTFGERYIIGGVIAFGHAMLMLTTLGMGYMTVRRAAPETLDGRRIAQTFVGVALTGLLTGGVLALLVVVGDGERLRSVLINASPQLIDLLRFEKEMAQGLLLLLLAGVAVSTVGGILCLVPAWLRNAMLAGLAAVILIGLLRDILRVVFSGRRFLTSMSSFLFASSGLTQKGAATLFVLFGSLTAAWLLLPKDGRDRLRTALLTGATGVLLVDLLRELRDASGALESVISVFFPPKGLTLLSAAVVFLAVGGLAAYFLPKKRLLLTICALILILIMPFYMRDYLTNVIDKVGLYILMGLGLNIVVGFSGLLDLGYVAFFAIGAYAIGVLTTTGALGGAELSFWLALPIAIGVSVLAGLVLGVPVLNMRGDYLAIVTLGFGEIIRVLAISNWFRPFIGGAQGVLSIPRPSVFGKELVSFQALYYLIIAGCVLALFISWRLRDSRLGRAWMAVREDEDVAEAMGINLVATKLLAFATGAAFAGAAGAIFASQIGSVFPHSFNLIVSINVLSLIIVGGMGSLPGVIVGSLFMVGLPEVFSELEEYRFLFYGATLVVMMLARPEGLWPEATRRRELHAAENEEEALEGAAVD